ncbi:hypothetical protein [Micromonospora arborensis]|uniref:hypothetical protein n=1 Tax=Micromonospora arborensis TaxID=2116518 RepID=UPI003712E94F
MMRKVLLFGVVLVLSFSVVVAVGNQRSSTGSQTRAGDTTRLDPAERTTTDDGRVSFTAPKGWMARPCLPSAGPGCVQLSPGGASEGDTVSVMTTTPNPVEGTPMDLLLIDDPALMVQDPSIERLTLDGAKVVRMDVADVPTGPWSSDAALPGVADVMVVGILPGSTDQLLINCRHDRLAVEMRAGCDLIVESLRFPR